MPYLEAKNSADVGVGHGVVGDRGSGTGGLSGDARPEPSQFSTHDILLLKQELENLRNEKDTHNREFARGRWERADKKLVFLPLHVLPVVGKGGKIPQLDMKRWLEGIRDTATEHDNDWVLQEAFSSQSLFGPANSQTQIWAKSQGESLGGGKLVLDSIYSQDLSSQGPYYIDPNTRVGESRRMRLYRVHFWQFLKASLIHHPSPLDGVSRYDNAALVKLVQATFASSKRETILNNIAAASTLHYKPSQWPLLSKEVVRLHSEMRLVVESGLQIGADVLPSFLLRALDAEPDYAVQLAKLREENAGVEKIVFTINARDNQLRARKPQGINGMPAGLDEYKQGSGRGKGKGKGGGRGGGGSGKGRPVGACFLFQDGYCPYGDACRFSHEAAGGECLACGSSEHGYDDCEVQQGVFPVGDKSGGGKGKNKGQPSAKEIKGMRAELAAFKAAAGPGAGGGISKVKGKKKGKKKATASDSSSGDESLEGNFASVNPFEVYGGDGELASLWSSKH